MPFRERLLAGIGGGLLGGVVFALLLQMAGRIENVALLIADEASMAMGWITLLVITGVLGIVYAATFGRLGHTWRTGPMLGLAHGVIWWVLGVLLIMPAMQASEFGVFTEATWLNLLGYALYGLIVGVVTTVMTPGTARAESQLTTEHQDGETSMS